MFDDIGLIGLAIGGLMAVATTAMVAIALRRPIAAGGVAGRMGSSGVAAFNQALVELQETLGLPTHESPVAGTHNTSAGSVAGRIVQIHVGVSGSMELEVGLELTHELVLHRRDVACSASPHALGPASMKPTPTGVADFDSWFHVGGADAKTIHGLQHNHELRSLGSHVVGTMGAQIHTGAIRLARRPVESGQELISLIEPLFELSMWLADPAGARPQVGLAIRSGTLRMVTAATAQGPMRIQALQQLLSLLPGGQVYHDSNEARTEWRGEQGGMRTRVVVDMANDIEIHMKIDNRVHFNLTYDEDAIPAAGRGSDPHRVFVSRGIFFGQQASPEEQWAAMSTLPPDMPEQLFHAMRRDGIRRLWFDPKELAIHYRDSLDAQLDPIGKFSRGLQLLGWVAPLIGTAPAPQIQARRASCAFCSTIFIHGQRNDCPNCGAKAA